MKTAAQLAESIERFRRVFWKKKPEGRPPVGVVNPDVFLPVKYLRQPFRGEYVEPEHVRTDRLMSDYEFAFANRPISCDDWMPFAAPWRAIPWLEAWCGCPVRFAAGSLAPVPIFNSAEALAAAPVPAQDKWFACLREQTERLTASRPRDCWISPTILRGPSDVLAALRGLTGFCYDLYDAPAIVDRVAGQINQLLIRALAQHFSIVSPKLGGYGHIFGYWAPGPTIAIQEDVLGLCRPAFYRDIFKKYNAELVRRLGGHVLFHLHSTGCKHYRDVLEIPGLAGVEITIEANGPSLPALAPVFREILERSRLVLFADHRVEELPTVLPRLPREGLYLVLPETCLRTEADFYRFVKASWPTARFSRGRQRSAPACPS
jgi:hypothetical protein